MGDEVETVRIISRIKVITRGLPWPASGFRRIPRVARQLRRCAATVEPLPHKQEKPPQWEAHTPRQRVGPALGN